MTFVLTIKEAQYNHIYFFYKPKLFTYCLVKRLDEKVRWLGGGGGGRFSPNFQKILFITFSPFSEQMQNKHGIK